MTVQDLLARDPQIGRGEQVLSAASLAQIFSLPFSLLPSYVIPHSNTKLWKQNCLFMS